MDFTSADLTIAICDKADMRGSIFNNTRLLGTSFDNAKLDGCDLSKAIDYIGLAGLLKQLNIEPDDVKIEQITDDGLSIPYDWKRKPSSNNK